MIYSIEFDGGQSVDSPSGRYSLSILAPLSPRHGGTYRLRLTSNPDVVEIRKIAMTLPITELNVALREEKASVAWNDAETFVDFLVEGKPLIRIWIPSRKRRD
jgi:hypothetical protein